MLNKSYIRGVDDDFIREIFALKAFILIMLFLILRRHQEIYISVTSIFLCVYRVKTKKMTR